VVKPLIELRGTDLNRAPAIKGAVAYRVGRVGWRSRNRWALLTPSLVFVAILTQIPFFVAIWYSLLHWNFLDPTSIRFTGLSNYVHIFKDVTFYHAIVNTVVITGGAVIASIVIGVGLALLMNLDIPGKNVLRLLLISPFFVMSSVDAILWKDMMMNPSFGLIDWLFRHWGLHTVDFLSKMPKASILIMMVWQWAPFMMLITLAGLQSMPQEILEAARVDGANVWQEFRAVVIPHLRKYLEIEFFLGVILLLQVFDVIYVSTQGGPGDSTTNLSYYVYLQGFSQYNVGGAAAVGVLGVIITTIIATFLFRVIMRFNQENT
jgi:sorbitol/mannitol transport system permease protein